MLSLLFIAHIIASRSAGASPICMLRREAIAAPSAVARYLLRARVIGKPDRRSAKDFAKDNDSTAIEITKRYAASADFQCGASISQAQLVVKNNIVLVAHHGLPGSPCVDAKGLDSCKVTFNEGGKFKQYGIKSLLKAGSECKPGFMNMGSEDWAIVELKEPVGSTIKPYQIQGAPCASNEKPVDVVAVGKSIDVGPAPSKGWSGWTKHYGNCQLRAGDCGQNFPALRSDCDTSGGSSGGGMFIGGADPKLIGIVSGLIPGCNGQASDQDGPYDELCRHSEYVPIAGTLKGFLDSFRKNSPVQSSPPEFDSVLPAQDSKGLQDL